MSRSPRHIRVLGRVAAITALVVAAAAVYSVWAGLPIRVESAMADAEWAPCVPRYAAARSARDSAGVDAWILRPRSRFQPAVTCGSLARQRSSDP
jgi:hypothetical protein